VILRVGWEMGSGKGWRGQLNTKKRIKREKLKNRLEEEGFNGNNKI